MQIKENYEVNASCSYCKAKITAENEQLPRIDYRETEILNLKQQIQNLKQELTEKEKQL